MSTTLKRIIPDTGSNTDFDNGKTAAEKINYNSELIEKKLDSVELGGGVPGDDGRGITNIERTSGTGEAGTIDTYTIYYTDATTSTFSVRNGSNGITPVPGQNGNWYLGTFDTGAKAVAVDGRGITNIARTNGNGEAGSTDTYTIYFTDNTTTTFNVVNGSNGTSGYSTETLGYALSDQETNIAVGIKIKDTISYNCTLESILLSLSEAPTGSVFQANVKKNGTSIFTTKITIDANELDSLTADTPYALVTTPTLFSVGDRIEISIDSVGGVTTGKGAIIKFNLIKT